MSITCRYGEDAVNYAFGLAMGGTPCDKAAVKMLKEVLAKVGPHCGISRLLLYVLLQLRRGSGQKSNKNGASGFTSRLLPSSTGMCKRVRCRAWLLPVHKAFEAEALKQSGCAPCTGQCAASRWLM